ncbi:phosphatidylglycerol lysyltransferase domain-containing protein [Rhizobium sp. 0TCS1.26]|uniref:phosphatidylglycerol lysyltransferase domain-containing protein n=1 Tax=Rhizobium sp. 0TCS1.26 TaxID=3142623 RepID=UPI003D2D95E0
MDIHAANLDVMQPAMPAAARLPKPALGAIFVEVLHAAVSAFGVKGAAALSLAVFLYLFLEEILFGLRLWSIPAGAAETGTSLSLTLITGAFAGRRLMRPMLRRRPKPEELARACQIVEAQTQASAGLVRLGDKQVLFSDSGDAFIMYACKGRSCIALFDPVGPRHAWQDLVVKFMGHARQSGYRPVFYQVSPDFLPIAAETGLRPYKLGEQATVDLTGFDMRGGDWLKLRRSINRAERDGLQFELIAQDRVPAHMAELRQVSDAWLAAHNAAEKGFSLGTFRPDYVASGSVAVIRIDGRIAAFASLLTGGGKGEAFIDLMRHVPSTHRGMMDLLFVRIMEHLKADGFGVLNLGMAPLAGLATHRRAPLWNRIGRHIFETGERYYNFKGVRAFKSKFDPDWQPRYMAVSGSGMPFSSACDVTMLIGGGLKGILRK